MATVWRAADRSDVEGGCTPGRVGMKGVGREGQHTIDEIPDDVKPQMVREAVFLRGEPPTGRSLLAPPLVDELPHGQHVVARYRRGVACYP